MLYPVTFFLRALNSDNGAILWSTPVGPGEGGTLGGIQWGTASDGKRIYVAIANSGHRPFTLVPSGQQITWGAWSALDVHTGKILWQTADPTAGTMDEGSVSVANGVMYAGSYAGQMYALDTITGKILWSFASGGSVIDGPSIVDSVLIGDRVIEISHRELETTKCTRSLWPTRNMGTATITTTSNRTIKARNSGIRSVASIIEPLNRLQLQLWVGLHTT